MVASSRTPLWHPVATLAYVGISAELPLAFWRPRTRPLQGNGRLRVFRLSFRDGDAGMHIVSKMVYSLRLTNHKMNIDEGCSGPGPSRRLPTWVIVSHPPLTWHCHAGTAADVTETTTTCCNQDASEANRCHSKHPEKNCQRRTRIWSMNASKLQNSCGLDWLHPSTKPGRTWPQWPWPRATPRQSWSGNRGPSGMTGITFPDASVIHQVNCIWYDFTWLHPALLPLQMLSWEPQLRDPTM